MLHRRLTARVCPSVLGSLAVLLFCIPLHAQQTGVPYILFNGLAGVMGVPLYCVSDGCPVQTQTLTGLTQQIWSLQPADWQGFYSIVNQTSGKVIDVPTPTCVDNNGCQLQQYDSSGAWQQQWTPVPTDYGWTFTLANRLSGKVIDNPTQCAGLDGCPLQQWDSNGGVQQMWQFVQQNNGQQNFPPPGGVTILVNGSFDDDPSWINPSDPEYQAIAVTFGDQPTDYQWIPNANIYPPLYSDIYNGGASLANFINSLNIPANQPLSIVAHSHGGNVVKIASYSISHQINYLVTLGTPQNWDLPEINLAAVGSYCEVSSLIDYVQFSGAGVVQVGAFGYDEAEAGIWTDQEAQDLYNGFYDDALYDVGQIAFYEADAFAWWMSTKLAFGAWNVLYDNLSHEDLHTAPVWSNIQRDCGLSN